MRKKKSDLIVFSKFPLLYCFFRGSYPNPLASFLSIFLATLHESNYRSETLHGRYPF